MTARLLLIVGIAVVVFATDDRWWAGFAVLAFIPLALIYAALTSGPDGAQTTSNCSLRSIDEAIDRLPDPENHDG